METQGPEFDPRNTLKTNKQMETNKQTATNTPYVVVVHIGIPKTRESKTDGWVSRACWSTRAPSY